MTVPELETIAEQFVDLERRQRSERAKRFARSPRKIADVMGQLMTRRGYGRIRGGGELQAAWQQAAGSLLAKHSRPTNLRRGVLQVVVENSTWMQELTFARDAILAKLQETAKDQGIRDLRFRLGSLK